tara:strand:- start:992 stop:1171 length:180 start_codon:yes stop_codon:yes gene_type:complete
MDEEKLLYIRDTLVHIQDFLFNQKEDEVPENCVDDLQTAIDYVNEFKEKIDEEFKEERE